MTETDKIAGLKIAGHENAGHENVKHARQTLLL